MPVQTRSATRRSRAMGAMKGAKRYEPYRMPNVPPRHRGAFVDFQTTFLEHKKKCDPAVPVRFTRKYAMKRQGWNIDLEIESEDEEDEDQETEPSNEIVDPEPIKRATCKRRRRRAKTSLRKQKARLEAAEASGKKLTRSRRKSGADVKPTRCSARIKAAKEAKQAAFS
ncbi:hypothetical protein OE88DRAFT_941483 [Heliocybe sulcata]|uniref:Uncharacterized protein n=1 Tax=Heliocybe sulcata TaxID=5364 RepID=A0A5C3NCD7_9AGAM|nr:hypothetical protein OE88DRAFT_941483 [Heliocybe sulcata]